MYVQGSVIGVAALLARQVAASSFNSLRARDSLDSFVATETTISLQGAQNNIGPNGSLVSGAGNYVVASPSLVNPDCQYLALISWKSKRLTN